MARLFNDSKSVMAEFNVNKGIGRSAEFQGLKTQYLFIFAGGLLGVFIVFVVMFMAGINQWVCIGSGIVSALILVYGTFYLNGKYGEHGLMKMQAKRSHPRHIINRRTVSRLFTNKKTAYEKCDESGNAGK